MDRLGDLSKVTKLIIVAFESDYGFIEFQRTNKMYSKRS